MQATLFECPRCGTPLQHDLTGKCPECGYGLESFAKQQAPMNSVLRNNRTMFCSHCGNEMLDSAVMCVRCGSSMRNYEAPNKTERHELLIAWLITIFLPGGWGVFCGIYTICKHRRGVHGIGMILYGLINLLFVMAIFAAIAGSH